MVFFKINYNKLFIVKWRIFIYMNIENKHSPVIFRFSKHKNLLDFGFKKQSKKYFKKYENDFKSDYTENELIEFIEYTYSYAKITLDKYSSDYSAM